MNCNGTEARLAECPINHFSFFGYGIAGVKCNVLDKDGSGKKYQLYTTNVKVG